MKITVTLETSNRGTITLQSQTLPDIDGAQGASLLAATYFDDLGPLVLGVLGVQPADGERPIHPCDHNDEEEEELSTIAARLVDQKHEEESDDHTEHIHTAPPTED